MQIRCDSCRKEFHLPEEKLPNTSRFRVKCPSCGNRIEVERSGDNHPSGEEAVSRDHSFLAYETTSPVEEDRAYLDLSPEKGKNALLLILDKDLLHRVRQPLEEEGYRLAAVSTSREALQVFQTSPLSLIVVEDKEECAPLLRKIHSQPGYTRREINCILVGDQAKSFDSEQAFYQKVNTYLSRSDRDRFEELLPQALGRYKQFIHPWLVARGEV